MSAFGSPWGDIDQTPPGTPYIVDSDGWGWFLLLILFAVPILLVASILSEAGGLLFRHPYLCGGIYIALSAWISFLKYRDKPKVHRVPGMFAAFLTMLPLGIAEGLYALPYLVLNSLISGLFEWLIVTAFVLAITVFLMSVIKNGFLHLFLALLFFMLTTLLVLGVLRSSDLVNWDAIYKLYTVGATG